MVEWAAAGGEIDLKYLDESGFCAWSEPTYTYYKLSPAKTARTNEEAWSEIKYCRAFST